MVPDMTVRQPAVLLIGPTGSGKTPLGEHMAKCGFRGRRCCHFDFGASLRRVAAGVQPGLLSGADVIFLKDILASGALLEDGRFYIAEKILRSFISCHAMQADDLVVLNGIPRHIGQADNVDAIVDLQEAVYLECTPEVVMERIRRNSGGDRTARTDDSMDEITNKLDIFKKRTMPLIDHYRNRGIDIRTVRVGIDMDPVEILDMITA